MLFEHVYMKFISCFIPTVYPLVTHCGWLGSMGMSLARGVHNTYAKYLM